MENIKEIFETISQRIKSPVLGYFTLAIIFTNWRPLYYLFFSGEPALTKFEYMNANITWTSFLLLPLLYGTIAAVITPWISFVGTWWAEKPTTKKRMITVEAANKVNQLRAKLRKEQNKEMKTLIEDAIQQDQDVQKITSEKLRRKLEKEIVQSHDLPRVIQNTNDDGSEIYEIETRKQRVRLLEKQAEIAREQGQADHADYLLDQAHRMLNKEIDPFNYK